MRLVAITSLIVAAGLAGTAAAQTPPTTEQGQAATAAPAAPAPPPAGSTASPTAAPAPAAAPGEPPPSLPTGGDGAAVISALDKVCKPLVQGGNFDQLATAAGFKKNRRDGSYSQLMGAKPYQIVISNPGSNKDVCSLTVNYAIGQERPIVTGLNVWAFLQNPQLVMQRNDFVTGADGVKRITLSWEYYTDAVSNGLVLVQQKRADDTPLNKGYDLATVLYSERKLK